jgi:predicted transglutaminase-like cysteine proteinase
VNRNSGQPSPRPIVLLFWVFLSLFGTGDGKDVFSLPEDLVNSAESRYGEAARRRLVAWQTLIRDNAGRSEMEKLENVNSFFNQLQFVDDLTHWQKPDYWATPVEFLSTGAGDCEDFSLAKYFTLKALGIAEDKLNMTYVRALQPKQAHMVVTYYAAADSVPLVLDNLTADIQPATARKDLLPVYSFNGLGLWLAKSRGKGQKVGSSEGLKRWQDLLNSMPEGLN